MPVSALVLCPVLTHPHYPQLRYSLPRYLHLHHHQLASFASARGRPWSCRHLRRRDRHKLVEDLPYTTYDGSACTACYGSPESGHRSHRGTRRGSDGRGEKRVCRRSVRRMTSRRSSTPRTLRSMRSASQLCDFNHTCRHYSLCFKRREMQANTRLVAESKSDEVRSTAEVQASLRVGTKCADTGVGGPSNGLCTGSYWSESTHSRKTSGSRDLHLCSTTGRAQFC